MDLSRHSLDTTSWKPSVEASSLKSPRPADIDRQGDSTSLLKIAILSP